MEIDRSKIPANKVYEKHCKGIMWSAILAFAVIGVFVAFLFLPIFAYFPAGGERVDMNGLNFISENPCVCSFTAIEEIYPK